MNTGKRTGTYFGLEVIRMYPVLLLTNEMNK